MWEGVMEHGSAKKHRREKSWKSQSSYSRAETARIDQIHLVVNISRIVIYKEQVEEQNIIDGLLRLLRLLLSDF